MGIKLFRIDDRLVHGQVMTAWSKVTSAQRIIILDNEVIKDDFVCLVMKQAVPKNIKLEIYNVQDGIKRLKELEDDLSTIVLMKFPFVALQIAKENVAIPSLNVGGMGMSAGRKKIYKNISATQEELDQLKELESLGTQVEFRILPEDKTVGLSSVL